MQPRKQIMHQVQVEVLKAKPEKLVEVKNKNSNMKILDEGKRVVYTTTIPKAVSSRK